MWTGEQRRETAEAKAEGIIREKLERPGWSEGQLSQRAKSGPAKLAMEARLRRATTLSLPRGLRPGCTREPGRALVPRFIDEEEPTKPLNDSPDFGLTPFPGEGEALATFVESDAPGYWRGF